MGEAKRDGNEAEGKDSKIDRRESMKERAKKARREAYQRAKDRMKNDPRQIALILMSRQMSEAFMP